MGELVIQNHNFENAKKGLKKFSEQDTTSLDLKKVDDSKGVGEFLGDWFLGRGIGLNHKVTGEELNELTKQIQTHLHSINGTQIKLVKEFGEVYSALEALDKEYIQAILVSIKATEETSQSIQETQGQIKKIVENQRRTLEELKKFKQKLDGYAHLGDIDNIWSDCQRWYKEINVLSNSMEDAAARSKENVEKIDAAKIALAAVERKTEDLFKMSGLLSERLESIIAFTITLEQVTHLEDVDEMWESLSSAHNSIRKLDEEFNSIQEIVSQNQKDINGLFTFRDKLSELKHLMEVDDIWERTEDYQLFVERFAKANKIQTDKLEELSQADSEIFERIDVNMGDIDCLKEYKKKLSEMSHLEDVDSIWKKVENHTSQLAEFERGEEGLAAIIQKNKEEVDEKIAATVQKNNSDVKSLMKQIKYAYLIAGGSAGLAVIELILLLIKVL